jgi:hypothetical protein
LLSLFSDRNEPIVYWVFSDSKTFETVTVAPDRKEVADMSRHKGKARLRLRLKRALGKRKLARSGAVLAMIVAMVAMLSGAVMGPATATDTTVVHVKQSSLSEHSGDCEGKGNVSGQLNITDPTNVVQDSLEVTTNKGTYTAADVTFDQQGNVMQITVPLAADEFITDATIEPKPGWSGQFVLSHYTCGEAPPPPPTKVTPVAPAFGEQCGTANDEVAIPAVEGVQYQLNDENVDSGVYPGVGTATVTAVAKDGFELDGYTGPWTHTFTDESCPQPPCTDQPCIGTPPTLGPPPVEHGHTGQTHNTPKLADTSYENSSSPWLPIGGMALLLTLPMIGLLRRSRARHGDKA